MAALRQGFDLFTIEAWGCGCVVLDSCTDRLRRRHADTTQNRERGRRAVGRQPSGLESDLKELKKPEPKRRGGKRPGAGMPKGKVTQKTIDKAIAREALRQYVCAICPQ